MSEFLTKRGLVALVAAANGEVPEERGVDLDPVFEVARRAQKATSDLPKDFQNIAIQLAVKDFLELATKGSSQNPSHTDLLPLGHPLSTASSYLSKESVLSMRATWLSADESLSDGTKDMLHHAASLSNEVSSRHAQARLRVLVASGSLPTEFAAVVEDNEESAMNSSDDLKAYVQDYYASRDAFLDTLNQQVSLNTGTNLYDADGKITRMVLRGDSRDKIKAQLMKNPVFQSNSELLESEPEDVFEGAVKIRFEEFLSALDDVIDAKQDPDYRETAIELIADYDEGGKIAKLIDEGADSYSVLKALDKVPAWSEDLRDYLTRGDVEISRPDQEDGWSKFSEIVDAIKDLDDYEEVEDSLTAALTPDK